MLQRSVSMFLILALCGCAQTAEVGKTVWGSSTRALEEARSSAETKTYACAYFDCFNEVLTAVESLEYTVFIKNPLKGTIVVMGVPGSVDTTEVGVFLTELEDQQIKLYVSSLSSHAKRVVANSLFAELDKKFASIDSAVPADAQALLQDL